LARDAWRARPSHPNPEQIRREARAFSLPTTVCQQRTGPSLLDGGPTRRVLDTGGDECKCNIAIVRLWERSYRQAGHADSSRDVRLFYKMECDSTGRRAWEEIMAHAMRTNMSGGIMYVRCSDENVPGVAGGWQRARGVKQPVTRWVSHAPRISYIIFEYSIETRLQRTWAGLDRRCGQIGTVQA
jgi:hypothetical protein